MPVTEEHNEHLKTLHLSGEAERGQDGDVSDGAVVDGNGESAATAGDAADGAADGADGAAVGANNEEGAFKEKLKKLDSSSSDEFDFSTNEFQRDLRDSSSEGPEFPGNEQDNTSAGARDAGEINIGHAAQNASLKDTTAPLHTVNGEGCGTGKGRADCSGGLRMTQRPPLRSIDSIHSPSSSPSPSQNSVPKFSNSYLKPNAKFVGDQVSDKSIYYVEVQFKTVDLVNSLVTGFLQITGLTDSPSHITTYFKGEIINNPLNKFDWKSDEYPDITDDSIKKFSFITENKKWDSNMKNDFDHWEILTQMRDLGDYQIRSKLNQIQSLDCQSQSNNQFIYMRWKEEFLVPDSRVEKIDGASFDGFYFIVLNIGDGGGGLKPLTRSHGSQLALSLSTNSLAYPQGYNPYRGYGHSSNGPYRQYSQQRDSKHSLSTPGSISGLYYHKNTERLQSLSLGFINDHGTSSNFEFC